MDKQELIAFEKEVADRFANGEIRGPVHLSGGNEDQLIKVFKEIDRNDFVFSTWRNHYHALLHGIDRDWLMGEILAGRSMNITCHRFYTSSIVGGSLPISTGVAAALKKDGSRRKAWCFVGDMAATTGSFHEAHSYAVLQDLPINFIVEDNGLSTDSPTRECWGNKTLGWFQHSENLSNKVLRYRYERTVPHVNIDKFVHF